ATFGKVKIPKGYVFDEKYSNTQDSFITTAFKVPRWRTPGEFLTNLFVPLIKIDESRRSHLIIYISSPTSRGIFETYPLNAGTKKNSNGVPFKFKMKNKKEQEL